MDKTNRNAIEIDETRKEENNRVFAHRLMMLLPIPPGGKVLEVGCGGGELAVELQRGYGLDCYGVEPFPMYTPKLAAERVFSGTAEKIPFPDGEFDLVIAKDVLEHVDQIDMSIDEMLRVSRKYAFIACPNYLFPYEAHFKVPFPPFIPKSIAKIYLRLWGFSRQQVGFIDHINYVTRRSLLKKIRASRFSRDVFAVVDVQLAKQLQRKSAFTDSFSNSKIELLIIKK